MNAVRRALMSAALATTLAASADAAVYNLALDWSISENPNGPWSMLSGDRVLPSSVTCCGLPAAPSFAPSSSVRTFLPVFYQAGGAGSDVSVHSYDPFNGLAATGEAILAWTALEDGLIDVSGYFYYDQNPFLRGNDVIVRLGDRLLDTRTVSAAAHSSPATAWAFLFDDLAVLQGDTLTFTFQRSAGQVSGSVTSGNVSVTTSSITGGGGNTGGGGSVPEPGTVALTLGGLLAVVLSTRRRTQRAVRE